MLATSIERRMKVDKICRCGCNQPHGYNKYHYDISMGEILWFATIECREKWKEKRGQAHGVDLSVKPKQLEIPLGTYHYS